MKKLPAPSRLNLKFFESMEGESGFEERPYKLYMYGVKNNPPRILSYSNPEWRDRDEHILNELIEKYNNKILEKIKNKKEVK